MAGTMVEPLILVIAKPEMRYLHYSPVLLHRQLRPLFLLRENVRRWMSR